MRARDTRAIADIRYGHRERYLNDLLDGRHRWLPTVERLRPHLPWKLVVRQTEKRTQIVDGRVRKSYGHRKSYDDWGIMLREHHDGYVSWDEFERNQRVLATNAYGRASRYSQAADYRGDVAPKLARPEVDP